MTSKALNLPMQMTLLGLTASICQSLYAETGSTEPVLLPVIKIEAVRTDTAWLNTPASVYRIEQKNHQNNIGVNLTETLQGVPGLQLNNRENYAQDLQLSMRGYGARSTFGVRGIRLYVDGIPATMPDGQGALSPYAMDKAAFPAKFAEAGTYYYMYDNGDYKLAFTNGDGYSLLKVDQEAARKIEAARSGYKDFAIIVYAYAQEADMASNQVKAQIVKVAVKLNGEEIPVSQAL